MSDHLSSAVILDNMLENMMILRKTLSTILTLLHSRRETAIEESLQQIRQFFSADRVTLGGFHNNGQEVFFIQEARSEGVPAFAFTAMQRIPASIQPWLLSTIYGGNHIVVSDMDEIPLAGEMEKQFMVQNGIQSFLAAPTVREDSINGFIVMEFVRQKRQWTSIDVENLHMFADLISLAVKQEQTKKELSESAYLLLKTESMFRIIFENLAWGLEVYDEKGRLIDINPADQKIFGVTKEQALGLNLFENPNLPNYLKEKARRGEEADMEIAYSFDTASQLGYYESEFKHSCRYIKGKCVPLKDAGQQVYGYLFLVNDDTENHYKNEEILFKEMELFKAKEADKLKSAFMANMSHEIRTPLNAIVGFSNILVDMNTSPDTESFREVINKNNDLLLQLVDDILDFSKIEMGTLDYKVADVDVKDVCREVVEGYSSLLGEGVSFVFDPELPSYIIRTDRKRIRQVICQFVSNAIKYTKEGSITLSYKQTDDQFVFQLTDTGIGMPAKAKEVIFNSFYQENEFNQGTGLGLTIAKSVVEGMGGRIGVDSVEGKGSTFWFSIPIK